MKARSVIWEVARREFLERWRSRALRISSAILLALVVVGAVLSTLADQDRPTDSFGLVGSRAVALAPALRMAGQAEARKTAVQRLPDRASADRAVRDGDVDVAIVGDRLVVKDSRDSAALAIAQRTIAAQGTAERLQAAGLTPAQAASALSPRALPVDVLDAHASDRERDSGMLSIGILILFFSLVVYGQSVAASVTEEKSSRVIELLLTSLPPRRLLTGKVLGVGTLGVLQLAVVCAAGLISARIAGSDALPPSTPETVALVVLWFVLGYAFFSVAYAALGALVSRQEDLEATTAPVNMLLVAAYLGANAAIQDPNGTWAQIAAFFPPLSPLIVPARVVLGDMGAVGLAAAVTVQVLATVLLIRLAATVYERSVLRIGAPMRLRAAVAGALADLHAPPWLLQGTAVLALVAGIAVGTDELLGIALLGAGVLLVVLQRFARHQPRA